MYFKKSSLDGNSWDLGCRGRDSNPRSHGIPGISQSTALLPYEPASNKYIYFYHYI